MANVTFAFYTDRPERTFAALRELAGDSLVRLDGKKIGPSDWYAAILVVDDAVSAKAAETWLGTHGVRGDLTIELKYGQNLRRMTLSDVIRVG